MTTDHWTIRCFHCGHPLNGQPIDHDGYHSQQCNACTLITFYGHRMTTDQLEALLDKEDRTAS